MLNLDAWVMDDTALCSSKGGAFSQGLRRDIAHGIVRQKAFRAGIRTVDTSALPELSILSDGVCSCCTSRHLSEDVSSCRWPQHVELIWCSGPWNDCSGAVSRASFSSIMEFLLETSSPICNVPKVLYWGKRTWNSGGTGVARLGPFP